MKKLNSLKKGNIQILKKEECVKVSGGGYWFWCCVYEEYRWIN